MRWNSRVTYITCHDHDTCGRPHAAAFTGSPVSRTAYTRFPHAVTAITTLYRAWRSGSHTCRSTTGFNFAWFGDITYLSSLPFASYLRTWFYLCRHYYSAELFSTFLYYHWDSLLLPKLYYLLLHSRVRACANISPFCAAAYAPRSIATHTAAPACAPPAFCAHACYCNPHHTLVPIIYHHHHTDCCFPTVRAHRSLPVVSSNLRFGCCCTCVRLYLLSVCTPAPTANARRFIILLRFPAALYAV